MNQPTLSRGALPAWLISNFSSSWLSVAVLFAKIGPNFLLLFISWVFRSKTAMSQPWCPDPKAAEVMFWKMLCHGLFSLSPISSYPCCKKKDQCGMIIMIIYILEGGWPTPLKNDGVSSSVGMMKFPTFHGKSWKSCSSHHQPVIINH